MRWTEEMAEAIVQLRAIYLSGDFNSSWSFHHRKRPAASPSQRLERRPKVATPISFAFELCHLAQRTAVALAVRGRLRALAEA